MAFAITFAIAVSVIANPVITVLVDDKKIEFDAQPKMVNNRTYVPARFITETFGGEVD